MQTFHPAESAIKRHDYAPFPNPHLRGNTFFISRQLRKRVWPGIVVSKRTAYHWENGRQRFTRRIQALNLRVLVAGKVGRAYPP